MNTFVQPRSHSTPSAIERSIGPYVVGAIVDELKRHQRKKDGSWHTGGRGRVFETILDGRGAKIRCMECQGVATEQV